MVRFKPRGEKGKKALNVIRRGRRRGSRKLRKYRFLARREEQNKASSLPVALPKRGKKKKGGTIFGQKGDKGGGQNPFLSFLLPCDGEGGKGRDAGLALGCVTGKEKKKAQKTKTISA